ncbi:MAG: serine/threonine-protein kinase [bacterium]
MGQAQFLGQGSYRSGLRSLIGILLQQRYKICDQIGAGGFSSVYLARDEQSNKVVAVKMLHEHLASQERIVQRFRKELEKAQKLNHPTIVRYLPEALSLTRQTTEALAYAHRQGLVHLDLKPANLMTMEGSKLKVMDFGIAKDLLGIPSDSSQFFTPRYASPDPQIWGQISNLSPKR